MHQRWQASEGRKQQATSLCSGADSMGAEYKAVLLSPKAREGQKSVTWPVPLSAA